MSSVAATATTSSATSTKPWNDVSDLNEELLFRAIHQYGFKSPIFDLNLFEYEKFKKALKDRVLDYHNGRQCGFRMKGSVIELPCSYDRDAQKSMKKVVELVRSGKYQPLVSPLQKEVDGKHKEIKSYLTLEDDLMSGRVCFACRGEMTVSNEYFKAPDPNDNRRLCCLCFCYTNFVFEGIEKHQLVFVPLNKQSLSSTSSVPDQSTKSKTLYQ